MEVHIEYTEGILSGEVRRGTKHTKNGVLLLHPHPRYGGDMDNHIVVTLEDILSRFGLTTMRFNFRGTSSSSGQYSGPRGALLDAQEASEFMRLELEVEKIGVIGYSFGGSIALGLATLIDAEFLVTFSASLSLLLETGVAIEELKRIVCPVLLLHGTSDRVVPFSDMHNISQKIGGLVERVTSESEGHFYTRTLPELSKEVVKFVSKVWKL
ncbi:MAG: alpha/beta hydrolase [Candidatus Thorarchaeota archaeon]|jgi:alpha/beta superfamily hydrolase